MNEFRTGYIHTAVAVVVLCFAACGETFIPSDQVTAGTGGNSTTSSESATAEQSGSAGGFVTSSLRTTATTGNTRSTTSSSSMRSMSTCGDLVIQPPEQCDDGNVDDADACRNSCALAVCGDGAQWSESGTLFEQCDDGNVTSGDGCSALCTLEDCGARACTPAWPGGECALGCDPLLCEGNTLCAEAGVFCDGGPASECVGRCMLYAADCAAIEGWPSAPESSGLLWCVSACMLL